MKIKKYKQIVERIGFDDIDQPFDYDDDDIARQNAFDKKRDKGKNDEKIEEPEYEEDLDESDDMQHLMYLLREMFKNSGFDVDVDHRDLDVCITVFLTNDEKLKSIVRIFDVTKKISNDILGEYDSDFEIYKDKKGQTMIIFNFTIDDGRNHEFPYDPSLYTDPHQNPHW